MNREYTAKLVRAWQEDGYRVALASGAFDLFHAGHLDFLAQLSGKVARLVVAITADATLKAKGENRPIIPEVQRAAIVEALRCVDGVFIFSEYGDNENLEIIKPDVFGRGDGHALDTMYERETIERLGIELVLIHSPRLTSTTEIISRIK